MTFWDFALQYPILAFCLLGITAIVAIEIVGKIVRAINIFKHGWPPAHCDADGDGVE